MGHERKELPTSLYGAMPIFSARDTCSSSSLQGRSAALLYKVLAPKIPSSGSGRFMGQDHCLRVPHSQNPFLFQKEEY